MPTLSGPWPRAGRRLHAAVWVVFFAYAAAVQLNDVDAWFWFPFYGAAGALFGLEWVRPVRPGVAWSVAAIAGLNAARVARGVPAAVSLLDSEEGRELLGSLIVALSMFALLALRRLGRGARAR